MNEKLLIPGAILIAGLLIAGGIFLSSGKGGFAHNEREGNTEQDASFGNSLSAQAKNVRPITEIDHVLGDATARVTIVEYSDYECPFCGRAHPTIEDIVAESNGQVRWVYRHFPLSNIHSRAMSASIASECVAELADNDAFWQFSDALFANQRSLGEDLYVQEANALGIDTQSFQACLNSGRHDDRIASDTENAVASGGRGTPFMIVINEQGDTFPFSGALPKEQMQAIVDQALAS